MIGILWFLNCYWAILIIRIAYNLVFKGSWANDFHGESIEANDVNLIKKKLIENQPEFVGEKAKTH